MDNEDVACIHSGIFLSHKNNEIMPSAATWIDLEIIITSDRERQIYDMAYSSVQFSHSVMSSSLKPHGLHHARLPCSSPTSGDYSDSCPSSWWCHPTSSPSVIPFSSRIKSFPASGSFPMSQFFTSGGQSIGISAPSSVLPMNIQDWFPFGLTGWISLQFKGLSRVFSNITVQKHPFFSAQLSL